MGHAISGDHAGPAERLRARDPVSGVPLRCAADLHTNAIEALNRQLRRKALKTKAHLPNEHAARKLIYHSMNNAVPAWTRTRNWTVALLALKIHFGDQLPD